MFAEKVSNKNRTVLLCAYLYCGMTMYSALWNDVSVVCKNTGVFYSVLGIFFCVVKGIGNVWLVLAVDVSVCWFMHEFLWFDLNLFAVPSVSSHQLLMFVQTSFIWSCTHRTFSFQAFLKFWLVQVCFFFIPLCMQLSVPFNELVAMEMFVTIKLTQPRCPTSVAVEVSQHCHTTLCDTRSYWCRATWTS